MLQIQTQDKETSIITHSNSIEKAIENNELFKTLRKLTVSCVYLNSLTKEDEFLLIVDPKNNFWRLFLIGIFPRSSSSSLSAIFKQYLSFLEVISLMQALSLLRNFSTLFSGKEKENLCFFF